MARVNYSNDLFTIILKAGGFYVARYLSQKFPRILFYHRFAEKNGWRRLGASTFERQIKMIRKSFNIISLKNLCARLVNGDMVPPNTIVFTIDDGYQDFYYYAYPVLRKYDIPATVYITTDFIDKKIWLWFDVIDYILSRTEFQSYPITLSDGTKKYSLMGKESRRRAWSEIAGHCLTLKSKEKEEFIKNLSNDLKVHVPHIPVPEYEALSWNEIREMKQHQIDFGSHTCTHSKLTMTESTALRHEIKGSKDRIEEMIDESIDSFCYPNGTREDFDGRIKEIVRESGYANATVAYCECEVDDLFELGRYGVGIDMLHFQKVIFGTEYLSTLLKECLRGTHR
jgi:peptidoglycan/xylan/chitin deacetylase (PgdA/CDA1 family)